MTSITQRTATVTDNIPIPSLGWVGKVASDIKMLKPVEPYKAKGIKERGQYVLRKEGKKK